MDRQKEFITKLNELYALGCDIQMDYYESDRTDNFIDELETFMMHCDVAIQVFKKGME